MSSQVIASEKEHLFHQVTQLALAEAAVLLCSDTPAKIGFALHSCCHGKRSDLLARLPADEEMLCISQTLRPQGQGTIAWLCPRTDARCLLGHLLAEELRLEALTEMEEEALAEIGNRIINRCLEHHSRLIPGFAGAGPPRLWRDSSAQLDHQIPGPGDSGAASLVEIIIRYPDREGRAWLLWCGQPWQMLAENPR